ncbi:MAG: DUF4852 domain-containing protein [Bdellovibrionales bacterium]
MIARFVFLFALVLLAAPARADDYSKTTFENYAKALVRYNAFDIKDDALLDDYAIITDCDLVKSLYDNDFQWSQVRSIIRDSLKMNLASFPTGFHYDSQVQLERYDFKNKTFRFTHKSMINAVNSFTLNFNSLAEWNCGGKELKHLPYTYTLVVGTPVTIGGLPFSEEDANALLKRLESEGNVSRVLYVRFNIRVLYIDPIRRSRVASEQQAYTQAGTRAGRTIRMDGRLDSVDFFEDKEHTRLIYSYTP